MTEKTTNLVEARSKVDDAEKALTAITDTEKGIAELKQKYGGVVFPVETTKGMDEAKAARKEVREPRYNIEHLRKDAKAPILALGRAVDSIAADLTAQVLEIEEPIDKQIKDEENRKAEEKRLAAEAEQKRIDDIKARIAEMHESVLTLTADVKASSESVDLALSGFLQLEIGDDFEEFRPDAQRTYDSCVFALETHAEAMKEREAEEKRQAERDAELEQLRKEKEERDRRDAEAEKERLAEEQRKADIKAELERKAEANKPAPIEEQLDDLSFGTKPDPVDQAMADIGLDKSVEDLVASGGLPEAQPVGSADPVAGSYVRPEIPDDKKEIDRSKESVFVRELREFGGRLQADGYPTAIIERAADRMQQLEDLVVTLSGEQA